MKKIPETGKWRSNIIAGLNRKKSEANMKSFNVKADRIKLLFLFFITLAALVIIRQWGGLYRPLWLDTFRISWLKFLGYPYKFGTL